MSGHYHTDEGIELASAGHVSPITDRKVSDPLACKAKRIFEGYKLEVAGFEVSYNQNGNEVTICLGSDRVFEINERQAIQKSIRHLAIETGLCVEINFRAQKTSTSNADDFETMQAKLGSGEGFPQVAFEIPSSALPDEERSQEFVNHALVEIVAKSVLHELGLERSEPDRLGELVSKIKESIEQIREAELSSVAELNGAICVILKNSMFSLGEESIWRIAQVLQSQAVEHGVPVLVKFVTDDSSVLTRFAEIFGTEVNLRTIKFRDGSRVHVQVSELDVLKITDLQKDRFRQSTGLELSVGGVRFDEPLITIAPTFQWISYSVAALDEELAKIASVFKNSRLASLLSSTPFVQGNRCVVYLGVDFLSLELLQNECNEISRELMCVAMPIELRLRTYHQNTIDSMVVSSVVEKWCQLLPFKDARVIGNDGKVNIICKNLPGERIRENEQVEVFLAGLRRLFANMDFEVIEDYSFLDIQEAVDTILETHSYWRVSLSQDRSSFNITIDGSISADEREEIARVVGLDFSVVSASTSDRHLTFYPTLDWRKISIAERGELMVAAFWGLPPELGVSNPKERRAENKIYWDGNHLVVPHRLRASEGYLESVVRDLRNFPVPIRFEELDEEGYAEKLTRVELANVVEKALPDGFLLRQISENSKVLTVSVVAIKEIVEKDTRLNEYCEDLRYIFGQPVIIDEVTISDELKNLISGASPQFARILCSGLTRDGRNLLPAGESRGTLFAIHSQRVRDELDSNVNREPLAARNGEFKDLTMEPWFLPDYPGTIRGEDAYSFESLPNGGTVVKVAFALPRIMLYGRLDRLAAANGQTTFLKRYPWANKFEPKSRGIQMIPWKIGLNRSFQSESTGPAIITQMEFGPDGCHVGSNEPFLAQIKIACSINEGGIPSELVTKIPDPEVLDEFGRAVRAKRLERGNLYFTKIDKGTKFPGHDFVSELSFLANLEASRLFLRNKIAGVWWVLDRPETEFFDLVKRLAKAIGVSQIDPSGSEADDILNLSSLLKSADFSSVSDDVWRASPRPQRTLVPNSTNYLVGEPLITFNRAIREYGDLLNMHQLYRYLGGLSTLSEEEIAMRFSASANTPARKSLLASELVLTEQALKGEPIFDKWIDGTAF